MIKQTTTIVKGVGFTIKRSHLDVLECITVLNEMVDSGFIDGYKIHLNNDSTVFDLVYKERR